MKNLTFLVRALFICVWLVQGYGSIEPQIVLEDPELEEYRVESVGHYEVLAKSTDKFINEGFNDEPFVIHHNDLDMENVLIRIPLLIHLKR